MVRFLMLMAIRAGAMAQISARDSFFADGALRKRHAAGAGMPGQGKARGDAGRRDGFDDGAAGFAARTRGAWKRPSGRRRRGATAEAELALSAATS